VPPSGDGGEEATVAEDKAIEVLVVVAVVAVEVVVGPPQSYPSEGLLEQTSEVEAVGVREVEEDFEEVVTKVQESTRGYPTRSIFSDLI
jgi:hypothetical protein